MSHPRGTYLGGVRSVECLRQRSSIDEVTGCWHWRLSCCEGAARVWMRHPETGEPYRTTGPNAAVLLERGRMLPKGKKGYRKCESLDCVNPEHVKVMTRAEHGAWVAALGLWKNKPNRILANRANKRKHAKLDVEKARAIRASAATQVELAKVYGVPQSTIGAVRAGKLWKETMPTASVFGWRP